MIRALATTVLLALALPQEEDGPAPAVKRGLDALRAVQAKDGSFSCFGDDFPGAAPHPVATTSAAAYTMLRFGASADDEAVRRALDWISRRHPLGAEPAKSDKPVYDFALATLALAEAVKRAPDGKPPADWKKALDKCSKWLIDANHRSEGGWNYDTSAGHDHYSTHFALMALHAASLAGVTVPRELWERERAHLKRAQLPSGAWKYICGTPLIKTTKDDPNPVLTAGAILGLIFAGVPSTDEAVRKGLDALPGLLGKREGAFSDPILLFSLDAGCRAAKADKLKDLDWYAKGCEALLKAQRSDGTFEPARQGWIGHCFSLLFLGRAGPPAPRAGR